MIISRRNLYFILIPGFLLSLLTILLAIWYGEFKTTIFGPGDDVRFGTWQLNTWSEWLWWFALQLSLGIFLAIGLYQLKPSLAYVLIRLQN